MDFQGNSPRLELGETKNGQGRNFPLTRELGNILEKQVQRAAEIATTTGGDIPRVFFHADGTPIRNFRDAWISACNGAG